MCIIFDTFDYALAGLQILGCEPEENEHMNMLNMLNRFTSNFAALESFCCIMQLYFLLFTDRLLKTVMIH